MILFFHSIKLYFCTHSRPGNYKINLMIKTIIVACLVIAALTSCSSLKPLNSNQQAAPVQVKSNNTKEIKFLDDISVTPQSSPLKSEPIKTKKEKYVQASSPEIKHNNSSDIPSIEKVSDLQLKYAVLLNVEAELLIGDPLLEHIDEWYGTRYRMGGTTKKGIDCSAFVQTVYLSAFGFALPRTAREQYKKSRIISATELKEGDLLFFNTRGGVSHVGIYLQNNKFVHASVSNGVTISDMYDPYYLRHFIGAGRIEKSEAKASYKEDKASN